MARVFVDVMLKREILDPQGQAVADALPGLGVTNVTAVRIGRHIELEFDGAPDLDKVRELADRLLANPVIEDYVIRLEPEQSNQAGAASAVPPAATPDATAVTRNEEGPETSRTTQTTGGDS